MPPSPLCIGPHRFAAASLLAPMSGVTDAPFRRIAQAFGAGAVVSEMIASRQLVARDMEALLKIEGEGIKPHIVQLAGCEAQPLAEAARIAETAGADIIDINMGCPAKRVTNGWAGSALMRDLDHASALIEAVLGAVTVPVTLKMRLGWDEASLNAPELAARAEALGVKLVTVHARTRQQFYAGTASWDAVRAVRSAVTVPLVVNGDIRSLGNAKAALTASGADAVMVGRAAVGRPWLVGAIGRGLTTRSEASEPDIEAQGIIALAHYEASLGHYGTTLGGRVVRKHLAAYLETALGETPDEATRQAVLGEDDPKKVTSALRRFYLDQAMERAA